MLVAGDETVHCTLYVKWKHTKWAANKKKNEKWHTIHRAVYSTICGQTQSESTNELIVATAAVYVCSYATAPYRE